MGGSTAIENSKGFPLYMAGSYVLIILLQTHSRYFLKSWGMMGFQMAVTTQRLAVDKETSRTRVTMVQQSRHTNTS